MACHTVPLRCHVFSHTTVFRACNKMASGSGAGYETIYTLRENFGMGMGLESYQSVHVLGKSRDSLIQERMEGSSGSLAAEEANQAICTMLQSTHFDNHHMEQYLLRCQRTGRSDFQVVLDGKAKSNGRSPLHIAAQRNFVDAVETVIRFGASVDSRGLQGETPLMLGCAVSTSITLKSNTGLQVHAQCAVLIH